MASVDDGSDVPVSSKLGTSSNYGSPNGSVSDLDGMVHRSIDAQFQRAPRYFVTTRAWIRTQTLRTTSRPL